MIDELPPDVRALITASRSALSPDAATVARMHAGVHAAVATGGVAAGASAVVAKIAVAAVVATGAAVAYVRHSSSAPPAEAPTVTLVEPSVAEHDVDVAPRVIVVEREPAPPPAVTRRPPPARVASPVKVVVANLAREIELVDQASRALRRGNHAAVQAAIRAYEIETAGHGQLAEDAAAITLEAACRSNDPDAAAKLAAFTRRWPHSALHTRLLAVCHEKEQP